MFLCFTLAFGVEAAAKPGLHEASLTAAAEEGPAVSKPEQLAQQRRISGYEVPGRVVEVRRGETVQSRPRPEFDPLGLRVGSFLLTTMYSRQTTRKRMISSPGYSRPSCWNPTGIGTR